MDAQQPTHRVRTAEELIDMSYENFWDLLKHYNEYTFPHEVRDSLYEKCYDLEHILNLAKRGMDITGKHISIPVGANTPQDRVNIQLDPKDTFEFFAYVVEKDSFSKIITVTKKALECDVLEDRWQFSDIFLSDYEAIKEALEWVGEMIIQVKNEGRTIYSLEVERFKKVGEKLVNSYEMVKFRQLISDISRKKSADAIYNVFPDMFKSSVGWQPFVFVCCSSGTGKTQIPFTLCKGDIPFLYMLDKVKVPEDESDITGQKVYHLFETISGKFDEACTADKAVIRRVLKKEKLNYIGLNNFEKIKEKGTKLKSAGFIVAVLEQLAEAHRRRQGDFDWIDAQLSIDLDNLNYVEKDLETAARDIDNIRLQMRGVTLKPLVFLDECVTSDKNMMFLFKRSLIRSLNLIPVIMGTDSKLHNIVRKSKKFYRSGGDDDVWGFVFHLLPEYPIEELQQKADELKNSFDRQEADYDRKVRFVDVIAECLVHERPLFVSPALDELERMVISEGAFNPGESLQAVLKSIHTVFLNRKDANDDFRDAQLRFLQHHYDSIYTLEATKINTDVNSHLGMLFDPCNGDLKDKHDDEIDRRLEASTGIITLALNHLHGVCYVLNGSKSKFVVNEYFASFKRAPLSTLAFASSTEGPHARNLFPPDVDTDTTERMSVMQVIYTMRGSTADTVSKKRAGDRLENRCKYALIASLSEKGFARKSMIDWLPLFFGEFEPRYPSSSTPFTLTYDSEELIDALKKIEMPFCAPIGEDWPDNLLKFVQEDCGGQIGRFDNTPDISEIDGLLYRLERSFDAAGKPIIEDIPLLTLECKYQNERITYSGIARILGKFELYSTKIQLIVAREFGGLGDITKKMTDYVKTRRMYVVYAERSDGRVNIKLLCGEPADDASCVILFPFDADKFLGIKRKTPKRPRRS